MSQEQTRIERIASQIGLWFGLGVGWACIAMLGMMTLLFAPTAFWIITGLLLAGQVLWIARLRAALRQSFAFWADVVSLVVILGWVTWPILTLFNISWTGSAF